MIKIGYAMAKKALQIPYPIVVLDFWQDKVKLGRC